MFFNGGVFKGALKALIVSLIFTVISVLLFALLLSLFSVPTAVVKPVNYLIKCLAVFLGCYLSVGDERGAIKGCLYGAIIMLGCYFVFSVASCNFSLTFSFLWDLILGTAVGGITGVVRVNRRAR